LRVPIWIQMIAERFMPLIDCTISRNSLDDAHQVACVRIHHAGLAKCKSWLGDHSPNNQPVRRNIFPEQYTVLLFDTLAYRYSRPSYDCTIAISRCPFSVRASEASSCNDIDHIQHTHLEQLRKDTLEISAMGGATLAHRIVSHVCL